MASPDSALSLSSAALNVPAYASKAASRSREGVVGRIDLSFGQPWFGPPEFLDDEMWLAVRSGVTNRYEASGGDPELREAIAARYTDSGYSNNGWQNVMVSQGASSAFALAILTVTDPHDTVLIPDPGYTLYAESCRILGRRPARYVRNVSDGYAVFEPAVRGLEATDAKLIVVNSPENPTGYVWDRDEMLALAEYCRQRAVYLLHDEVYDDFVFDGASHLSAHGPEESSHVVLINSFSKRYGLPSLRIGWLRASESIVRAAGRLQDYLSMSVSSINETLAHLLLRDANAKGWVARRAMELQLARDDVCSSLLGRGDHFGETYVPKGGMFLFLNVKPLADRLAYGKYQTDGSSSGETVAQYLEDRALVATLPGRVYGTAGEDYIRLVLAVPPQQLERAVGRILDALPDL